MDPTTDDGKVNRLNENSEGGGDGGTTIAVQKKRSRRVSFAEMTSVHFFDRDDDETPGTDTPKAGDNLGSDLGFGRQLEQPKDAEGGDDDDNDEEMLTRSSFFRPIESPSPGSTIGSATSNDEDNFFGPVSASFIRPGRLSDSAASDDGHDVTMDSTAFSMHFRSLARSESGVDLKTPTGVHLTSKEKTSTNENVGSFMTLTLVEKPISKSFIPATDVSGSRDSDDMSLESENRKRYNYAKLSPDMEALLARRKNFFAIGASDELNASQSPGRMESNLFDLRGVAERERGSIISHDLLSKEVSDVHGKFQEANGGTGTSLVCYPLQEFSFSPNNAAAFDISEGNQNRSLNQLSKDRLQEPVKETHEMCRPDVSVAITDDGLSEPNNTSSQFNQNSHKESGSPMVGSTSLLAKRSQRSPSNSAPSKYLRLGSSFQERHPFSSSEYTERLQRNLSGQKTISKLASLERSSFSSSLSTEIDKSYVKSLSSFYSPHFDKFKEIEHEDLKSNHVEDLVDGEKLPSLKEQRGTFSIINNRFESPNRNMNENLLQESSANTKSEKYSNDMHASILHTDQSMKYAGNAASPSQFTGPGKEKEQGFVTSISTSDIVLTSPRTESSLAKNTSDKGMKAIRSPYGHVSSVRKRLEDMLPTSPAYQGGQSKDSDLQNQFAQHPDSDTVQDSSLKDSVIDANLSTPTADMDYLSMERIEEVSSPEFRGFQNLVEAEARDDREADLNPEEAYETNGNYISPMKHEKLQIMHSKADGGLQSCKDISMSEDNLSAREFIDISQGSVSTSVSRNSDEPRFQNISHQNLVEFLAESPLRKAINNRQSSNVLSPESYQMDKRVQNISADETKNAVLHRNEITKMQKSPEHQKSGCCDQQTLEYQNDGSRVEIVIDHEWKQWTTVLQIYSKFSEDTKQLISQLTEDLCLKAIDAFEEFLLRLQRSKIYELLHNEILTQETFDLHKLKHEKLGETRLLLHRIVLEKAKLQLKNVKRKRLLKTSQILSSRIQELQMLKTISLSRLPKTRAANIKSDSLSHQSFSIDSENRCEDVLEKLTTTRQALEASERKIAKLSTTFHACCKIKGEPSFGDTIALVREHLVNKARRRFIRQCIQTWVVHNVESMYDQQNLVLDYLDFAVQSLKVNVGPASTIAISFKLNNGKIEKNFPNMDARSAFAFVFDADILKKYVGARTLVTETQATRSLLGTLLDVLDEVQLAELELPNLHGASFYCPSDEQLHLRLCFIKLISGRKVTMALDLSCLKRGVYPSEVLPLHLTAPADRPQCSSSEQALAEIRNAVKKVNNGYMRIFRLCKCVSEVLRASSA